MFLSDDVRDSFWYASFGAHANVDIWEVRAEGFSLQEDNEDWICGAVIQPDRLTLIEADISPDAAVAWLDAEPSTGLLSRVEDRSDQGFDGHERMP